jgi:TolA-binding protein
MSKKPESLNVRLTRLQQSRYERERRQRRFIILGSILVGIVTVVLVIAAILQIAVIEPQRAAASVGGQTITVQNLQKRMRYDQAQLVNRYNQLQQQISQLQQGDPSGQFLVQFYQQQLQSLAAQGSAEQIARNSLDTMVENILVQQEAARRGIAVTAEEVQTQLEKDFGLFRQTLTPFPTDTPAPPTATSIPLPTPTGTITAAAALTQTDGLTATQTTTAVVPTEGPLPTSTPRLQPTSIDETDFQLLYQRAVDSYQPLGFADADLRALIEGNLYREKVQKAFADETATRAPHFKFDYIRFNTEADATTALGRLTSNQIDFAALISETNAITQPAAIGNGTAVDWTSQLRVVNQFGQNIADQLSVKSIGAPTGIVTSTDGGFYVLLPLGREERALEQSELESEQQRTFSDWLNKAREDVARVQELVDPTTVVPSAVRDAARNFQLEVGATQP